jgi:hypothetical protein
MIRKKEEGRRRTMSPKKGHQSKIMIIGMCIDMIRKKEEGRRRTMSPKKGHQSKIMIIGMCTHDQKKGRRQKKNTPQGSPESQLSQPDSPPLTSVTTQQCHSLTKIRSCKCRWNGRRRKTERKRSNGGKRGETEVKRSDGGTSSG